MLKKDQLKKKIQNTRLEKYEYLPKLNWSTRTLWECSYKYCNPPSPREKPMIF